ncbi:MAG TPA: DUF2007 domain-containing protein [Gemmatales bacterium]|nr:DUF2007 domain-containing protein [Gemmatales bacterium]HMP58694.1 DUF2007 domain-containing protein [Gemmatales bacterium]
MKHDDLVVVYKLHDPIKAEVIRAALQTEGIAARLDGTNFSQAFPGSPMQEVNILVRAEDADRAAKFIEKHQNP